MLRLDKLPTPLLKRIDDALAGISQHPGVPVVAVEHIVGLDLQQVRHVVQRLLRHHLFDADDVLDDDLALLVWHVWQSLVASDCVVGQQADDHLAQLPGFLDELHVTWRDQIGAHRNIDCFHNPTLPELKFSV